MKAKVVLVAFGALFLAAVACSNQGEGERCLSDDDCQSGLVCSARTSLTTGARVCCPSGNTASSSEYCRAGTTDITNPDASGPITPVEDGGDAASNQDGGQDDEDAATEDAATEDGGDASDLSDADTNG